MDTAVLSFSSSSRNRPVSSLTVNTAIPFQPQSQRASVQRVNSIVGYRRPDASSQTKRGVQYPSLERIVYDSATHRGTYIQRIGTSNSGRSLLKVQSVPDLSHRYASGDVERPASAQPQRHSLRKACPSRPGGGIVRYGGGNSERAGKRLSVSYTPSPITPLFGGGRYIQKINGLAPLLDLGPPKFYESPRNSLPTTPDLDHVPLPPTPGLEIDDLAIPPTPDTSSSSRPPSTPSSAGPILANGMRAVRYGSTSTLHSVSEWSEAGVNLDDGYPVKVVIDLDEDDTVGAGKGNAAFRPPPRTSSTQAFQQDQHQRPADKKVPPPLPTVPTKDANRLSAIPASPVSPASASSTASIRSWDTSFLDLGSGTKNAGSGFKSMMGKMSRWSSSKA